MDSSSSNNNRFSGWEDAVADAVAFAKKYPAEVRAGIVQTLLSSVAPSATANDRTTEMPAGATASSGQPLAPISRVAECAGVEATALGRFIQIGDDGTVTIHARLGGDTVAGRQNAYSVVLVYVREKALGELDTESALVRAVCTEHQCNDGNLTVNLKKRGWLLGSGAKGARKSYRLSPSGEAAAREALVSLCAVD